MSTNMTPGGQGGSWPLVRGPMSWQKEELSVKDMQRRGSFSPTIPTSCQVCRAGKSPDPRTPTTPNPSREPGAAGGLTHPNIGVLGTFPTLPGAMTSVRVSDATLPCRRVSGRAPSSPGRQPLSPPPLSLLFYPSNLLSLSLTFSS